MEPFLFYLKEADDTELLKLIKYPTPYKPGKWRVYVEFIYSKNPSAHIWRSNHACCFCSGNCTIICGLCEKKMMDKREQAIRALTINNMIDSCILLKQIGIIDDIINYIIIGIHNKKPKFL